MEQSNFKDWTLTKLDKAFGLQQIWDCDLLEKWQKLAQNQEISDLDRQTLLKLQKPIIKVGEAWNEAELETRFISPIILQSDIDDDDMSYFLERNLKATIGEYELKGKVDGMVATGFREPDIPYFCMHEYKKSIENAGKPDAQALVAMLVARELNNNQKPIYGLYIVGLIWRFVVLNENEYCISKIYNAESLEVFDIFKMLKALKVIIKTELI